MNARGLCHAHFEYFRRHGVVKDSPILDTFEKRFWAKVNKTETCWLWTAATDGQGRYGSIYRAGRNQRAHRVAYELLVGPIPDGYSLDHLCKVTLCVRPEHLEAVLQLENVMRGDAPTAANAAKTHCKRGHEFTEENTYRKKDGGRMCRICQRVATREAQRRLRARQK